MSAGSSKAEREPSKLDAEGSIPSRRSKTIGLCEDCGEVEMPDDWPPGMSVFGLGTDWGRDPPRVYFKCKCGKKAYLKRERDPKVVRASGDVICEICGKKYYDHPKDGAPWALSHDGRPFLHIACDGTRLKL
jgi:hypothetical protein